MKGGPWLIKYFRRTDEMQELDGWQWLGGLMA